MKFLIYLFASCAVFGACNKEVAKLPADKVMVRIENLTGQVISNAQIAGVFYAEVSNNKTSDYQAMITPMSGIICQFEVEGQQAYAGVGFCGTPPPANLASGFYTITIMGQDNTGAYSFSTSKD